MKTKILIFAAVLCAVGFSQDKGIATREKTEVALPSSADPAVAPKIPDAHVIEMLELQTQLIAAQREQAAAQAKALQAVLQAQQIQGALEKAEAKMREDCGGTAVLIRDENNRPKCLMKPEAATSERVELPKKD